MVQRSMERILRLSEANRGTFTSATWEFGRGIGRGFKETNSGFWGTDRAGNLRATEGRWRASVKVTSEIRQGFRGTKPGSEGARKARVDHAGRGGKGETAGMFRTGGGGATWPREGREGKADPAAGPGDDELRENRLGGRPIPPGRANRPTPRSAAAVSHNGAYDTSPEVLAKSSDAPPADAKYPGAGDLPRRPPGRRRILARQTARNRP